MKKVEVNLEVLEFIYKKGFNSYSSSQSDGMLHAIDIILYNTLEPDEVRKIKEKWWEEIREHRNFLEEKIDSRTWEKTICPSCHVEYLEYRDGIVKCGDCGLNRSEEEVIELINEE